MTKGKEVSDPVVTEITWDNLRTEIFLNGSFIKMTHYCN